MKSIRNTFIHRVPSATYHHTVGEKYLFLDFVDRNRTIKYKVRSKIGKVLLERVKRLGVKKVTYPL